MKIDTDNFKIAGTAKIERNDNGVAISYDDGTLICTNSVRKLVKMPKFGERFL